MPKKLQFAKRLVAAKVLSGEASVHRCLPNLLCDPDGSFSQVGITTMKIELRPATLGGFDPRAGIVLRGIRIGFEDVDIGIHAVSAVLAAVERAPRRSPWSSYWAWAQDEGCYVGLCAFKAPPADGAVEIAYYTYPALEGRGIATRMAAMQIAIAKAHNMRTVRAHTLPEANASGAILTRLNFVKIGTLIDPEDGPVWAWELVLNK